MVCTPKLTTLFSSLVISLVQILNWTLFILQIIHNTQIQEPVTDCLNRSQLSNKPYHWQISSISTNVILQTLTFTKHFSYLLNLFILLQQLDNAHLTWISEIKWINSRKNFLADMTDLQKIPQSPPPPIFSFKKA